MSYHSQSISLITALIMGVLGSATLIENANSAEAQLPLAKPDSIDPAATDPVAAPSDLLGSPNQPGGAEAAPSPSQNVTINLINRLVQKGVLTHEDANELIKQAEEDAAAARMLAAAPPASDDSVRVTYIPEIVKQQLRDQLKDDVLKQARDERWANPRMFPDWAKRFTFFGDVRVRYEGTYFPTGNDNTGSFPNFNAINTGAPFDVSGTNFSPQHNVDQQRDRIRFRVRFGADVNLEDGWSAGFRLATGDTSSPVSANQTFGVANQGQGGNFSKYAIWIDRGFIKYELGGKPSANLALSVGRFDNPFFTTSEIMWDEDVGFDGLALQGKYEIAKGVKPFFSAGVFPIFNTDFNFSSNQPAKFESTDKWLYAVQGGIDLKLSKDLNAKFAVGYFDFDGVEGKLSDPYIPLSQNDASSTDNTRPSFAQKGNTYRPIRNIVPDALNNFGTTNQFQYFGLATPFQVLSYNAKLEYNGFEPVQISLIGEYAKNLAWDKTSINETAVNNRGPLPPATTTTTTTPTGTTTSPPPIGAYDGGDTAWNVGLVVGRSVFEKAGDWNISFGYRHVESDSVVDAFTDSDFAGGGTNVKGYTIGAAVALSPRVKLGARWMGANQIAGPPLKTDVLLIDLSAKF